MPVLHSDGDNHCWHEPSLNERLTAYGKNDSKNDFRTACPCNLRNQHKRHQAQAITGTDRDKFPGPQEAEGLELRNTASS